MERSLPRGTLTVMVLGQFLARFNVAENPASSQVQESAISQMCFFEEDITACPAQSDER
jgi:hypothetical protein